MRHDPAPRATRTAAFVVLAAIGASAVAFAAGDAALLSKRFEYRSGVILEIGRTVDESVRLDTVRFRAPDAPAGRVARTAGLHAADVALSNVSAVPTRVGVAIALYDDEQRLVAVASGGSGLKPIKPDRQRTIRVVFDDVNAFAADAAAFEISVEVRP